MSTRPERSSDATPFTTAELTIRSTSIERLLARFRDVALRAGSAHGLSGDDLDEVIQDVRIRLWHAASALQKLETLTPAYVYRTACSAALDLLRRRRARHELRMDDELSSSDGPLSSEAPPADAALLTAESVRAIELAVSTLAPNRRAVVRMHLAGYGREEIAELLGWSEAKTRNLLYRGLDDLRAALRARGIGPEGER